MAEVASTTGTEATVSELLAEAADVFNRMRSLGVQVIMRYDILLTDHGYVLPGTNGEWEAKFKISDPYLVPQGDPTDD